MQLWKIVVGLSIIPCVVVGVVGVEAMDKVIVMLCISLVVFNLIVLVTSE